MTARERVRDVLDRHFPLESPEGRATVELVDDQPLEIDEGRVYGYLRCIRWISEEGERRIEDIVEQPEIYLGRLEHFVNVERYATFLRAVRRDLDPLADVPLMPREIVHAAQLHDEERRESEDFGLETDLEVREPAARCRRGEATGACEGRVVRLAASRDGGRVVASDGETLVGWHPSEREPAWVQPVSVTGPIELSPDGDRLIVGEDDPTRPVLRAAETGEVASRADVAADCSSFGSKGLRHLKIESPEGGEALRARLFEGWPPEPVAEGTSEDRPFVRRISMDPDAKRAVIHGYNQLVGWDLERMEQIWSERSRFELIERREGPVNVSLAMSTDLTVINEKMGWELFAAETGDYLGDGDFVSEAGSAVALTRESEHLALPSGSRVEAEGDVSVYRIRQEPVRYAAVERVLRLTDLPETTIDSLAFSDDGRWLVAGGADGSLTAFEVEL